MGLTRKYAERALKLLHKALPELRMGRDFLFVPPVGHILRCFVLGTNVEIKGTAYFWRAVMPLYRRSGSLVVNYGERLLGGERVSLLESELDRTIDRLAQTVRNGELARLSAIQSPQDFLQQVDWASLPSTPNYQIDLALTHYMSGNAKTCQQMLDQLAGTPPSPRWAGTISLAQDMAQELRANPSALDSRIKVQEQLMMKWLNLVPPARQKRLGTN